MNCKLPESGLPAEGLRRYIEDQVLTLLGINDPTEKFSILLTGSRATDRWALGSDVDIEVLCPRTIYQSIQQAMVSAGRIKSLGASLYTLRDDNWQTYFGEQAGRPHFSVSPIEDLRRHFQEYDDVWIWIWTHAKIIHDPREQFRREREAYTGYPHEVLVRKIKYHWMLAAYRAIEESPIHPTEDVELLPAGAALLNGINELYRFFFLVEGKPFPYTKRLVRYVSSTELGRQFLPS